MRRVRMRSKFSTAGRFLAVNETESSLARLPPSLLWYGVAAVNKYGRERAWGERARVLRATACSQRERSHKPGARASFVKAFFACCARLARVRVCVCLFFFACCVAVSLSHSRFVFGGAHLEQLFSVFVLAACLLLDSVDN